ncbi:MAG: AGE family epimerase/isomerase [Gemmatimonadetes bacterium]|nr:AGE family epimerase/isomerase [Gemmatimonadota bacterium]
MEAKSGAGGAKNRLDALDARRTLTRILTENVVPFWSARVVDLEEGGYRTNHDRYGICKGRADKHLITQARVVWFFSRLAGTPYGRATDLKVAEHGYLFLRDCMWDRQFGGFFWEVDPSGSRPTRPGKHVCAQTYGLYGLAEYARASGDSGAATLRQRAVQPAGTCSRPDPWRIPRVFPA